MSAFAQRPGTPADWRVVYRSTAKTMRQSPYYRDLAPAAYTSMINRVLGERLEHAEWRLTIEYPTSEPSEVAGFVLARAQPLVVGMVYVKEAYRGRKVARRLLEAAGVRPGVPFAAVMGSPKWWNVARDKGLRVRLSPYLL